MSNKFKKILVIGGSGFIGSHTSDILSKNGHKVTILDKVKSPWLRSDQEMIVADIMEDKILSECIKNKDYIYFFGGVSDIGEAVLEPYKTIETNIIGLTKTLETAVKHDIKKIIYASTMYVYSSQGSFYRASKQAAEIIIETYHENFGIDYVLLRYGSLYGPRSQDWNGIKGFVEQAIKKGFIEYSGNGSEVREYINVLDAANLSFKILHEDYRNRAVTITGQQSIKVSDMFAMICDIIGKKIDINYLNKNEHRHHYGSTPYRYTPKPSLKITPNEFVDLGQGLLDVIEETYRSK